MVEPAPGPQNVKFPTNGHEAFGYLALPEEATGPGVLVIQEWWGITDHIVDVTNRFAAAGFVALAPDLYGGRVAHDREEARTMMAELPVDRAVVELSGAVDFLLAHERVSSATVGAVGFCMGGGFVLVLAARDPRVGAAVPYYAVGAYEEADLATIASPVLGHFAEHDASVPLERVERLKERLEASSSPEVDIRVHPNSGHAFFNDEGANYDEGLARETWGTTVSFLRRHLT